MVACPLHEGRFDLFVDDPGADADHRRSRPDPGRYHGVWTVAGKEVKDDVPGKKAEALRDPLRRLRYYPLRIARDRAWSRCTSTPRDDRRQRLRRGVARRVRGDAGRDRPSPWRTPSGPGATTLAAVPGLAAKPVIDIDVIGVAARPTCSPENVAQLDDGYVHLGELGVAGRHAFHAYRGRRHNLCRHRGPRASEATLAVRVPAHPPARRPRRRPS